MHSIWFEILNTVESTESRKTDEKKNKLSAIEHQIYTMEYYFLIKKFTQEITQLHALTNKNIKYKKLCQNTDKNDTQNLQNFSFMSILALV